MFVMQWEISFFKSTIKLFARYSILSLLSIPATRNPGRRFNSDGAEGAYLFVYLLSLLQLKFRILVAMGRDYLASAERVKWQGRLRHEYKNIVVNCTRPVTVDRQHGRFAEISLLSSEGLPRLSTDLAEKLIFSNIFRRHSRRKSPHWDFYALFYRVRLLSASYKFLFTHHVAKACLVCRSRIQMCIEMCVHTRATLSQSNVSTASKSFRE